MKKFCYSVICIVLFLSSSVYFSSFFKSQTMQIGVVDELKIRTESIPFLLVKELVDRYHKTLQQELLEQESELRQEYEFLQKSLEPNVEERKQAFYKKISKIHQDIQKRQDALNQKLNKVTQHITNTLEKVIHQIVSSNKIQIIFNMNLMDRFAWVDSSLNVTDEVIKKLNQALPNIEKVMGKNGIL